MSNSRYDTLGRLSSIDAGGGLHTKYSYDFLGRLAKIETPAGSISYEHWNGQGKAIRTLPNGIRTHWGSQPDGRLTAITHVAKHDAILAQFTYSYRPDGLVNGVKEWWPQGERIITYDYDTAQQLTTVTDSQSGKYNYHCTERKGRLKRSLW